jgi:hypothetical protein
MVLYAAYGYGDVRAANGYGVVRAAHGNGIVLKIVDQAEMIDICRSRFADVGWRTQRKSGALLRWRGLSGTVLFLYRAGVSWFAQ